MSTQRILTMDLDVSPRSCVAVYLWEVLNTKTNIKIDLKQIAKELNIKVGKDDPNPWKLNTVNDINYTGITFNDASKRIPNLLNNLKSNLHFFKINLNEIPYELYHEEVDDLLNSNCSIGIGFELSVINHDSKGLFHLARIIDSNNKYVTLRDYPPEKGWREYQVEWDKISASSRRIGDGLWVLSPKH